MNGFSCFTDGGATLDTKIGGWAFVIAEDGRIVYTDSGSETDTTNQRMELTAAIKALEFLPDEATMTIYADSQYVVKGATEWLSNWKKNNWRNAQRKPVMNQDLWEEMDRLVRCHPNMSFQWVRGHAGNVLNEATDRLVKHAIRNSRCIQK
jgi:ribonuclease HI